MKKTTALKHDPLADSRTFGVGYGAQGAGEASRILENELLPAYRAVSAALNEATELMQIAVRASKVMNPDRDGGALQGDQPSVVAPMPRGRKLSQAGAASSSRTWRKPSCGSPPEVHVRDVAKAIADEGIDIGVRVPGTAVGNVLNKSPDWKRRRSFRLCRQVRLRRK